MIVRIIPFLFGEKEGVKKVLFFSFALIEWYGLLKKFVIHVGRLQMK